MSAVAYTSYRYALKIELNFSHRLTKYTYLVLSYSNDIHRGRIRLRATNPVPNITLL